METKRPTKCADGLPSRKTGPVKVKLDVPDSMFRRNRHQGVL